MSRRRGPAIPFISADRRSPELSEANIFEALRPVFPGIREVALAADAGSSFFGSNVQFRNCVISSGIHPAIRVRSTDKGPSDDIAFLITFSGTCDFRFSGSRSLTLQPQTAAIISDQDWSASSTDYGGVVIKMPKRRLMDSLSQTLKRDVKLEDVEEFYLGTEAGFGLRRSLQSLQMIYQPALARSGLYDDHILSSVALFIAQRQTREPREMANRMKRLADRACSLIRENIKAELTIGEISTTLGVSERYLQIAFQAAFGVGPKQWMLFEKLSAAKEEILTTPSVKLARLAEDYCFSSPAHFSAAFKKAFGVSPGRLKQ